MVNIIQVKDILQKELNEAIALFNDQAHLDDIFNVSSDISYQYDEKLKTGGLNGWQPLGISAKAGEKGHHLCWKRKCSKWNKCSIEIGCYTATCRIESGGSVIATLKVGRK